MKWLSNIYWIFLFISHLSYFKMLWQTFNASNVGPDIEFSWGTRRLGFTLYRYCIQFCFSHGRQEWMHLCSTRECLCGEKVLLYCLPFGISCISYCCAKGKRKTFKQRLEWWNAMWYNWIWNHQVQMSWNVGLLDCKSSALTLKTNFPY